MNSIQDAREHGLDDPDVVVAARNVSKKFCRRLQRSMFYGILDLTKNLVGVRPDTMSLHRDEFWAVDDVSFELRRGEVLGLIGANGSGKTTMLRLLAGILPPDRGEISIRGRVGALISLGAGFHPHMTGRENIYINGTILGMERAEIDEKFKSILDFAEIGEFIDAPVATYSSGMRVRLGFAVAIHTDPELLLIDEILAVGDVGFRSKCYGIISDLLRNCAVIFVSHMMPTISRICDRVIVLNKGKILYEGDTASAIHAYYSVFQDFFIPKQLGTGEAKVTNFKLLDEEGKEPESFNYGDPLKVSFDVEVSKDYPEFLVSLSIMGRGGELIGQCHSGYHSLELRNNGGPMKVEVSIPRLQLNPDSYAVNLIIFDKTNNRHLCWLYATKKLNVKGPFVGSASVQWLADWRISQP
jgi:lipopolysaccharide transport system ATP-binding protein